MVSPTKVYSILHSNTAPSCPGGVQLNIRPSSQFEPGIISRCRSLNELQDDAIVDLIEDADLGWGVEGAVTSTADFDDSHLAYQASSSHDRAGSNHSVESAAILTADYDSLDH